MKHHMGDSKGFSLMEVLLAAVILSIAILPMLGAYGPGIFSGNEQERSAVFTNRARATLNRVTALPFQTLDNNKGNIVDLAVILGSEEEAAKESFVFKGETYTPGLSIKDVSEGRGGLLEVEITIHGVSLKTYKADY